MRAMVLERPRERLIERNLPVPDPGPGELLVRVEACGVCRTDLHVIDGDLPFPGHPVVPGHEIVGRVSALGAGGDGALVGRRVGVPWLASTCGRCAFCLSGAENLCDDAEFTGYTRAGGYAEFVCVDARFAFPLPEARDAIALAPLLCAGLIGYRAYRMVGDATRLGLYGFGAAAHILVQIAAWQGRRVFAFTRPGDEAGQARARALGAEWSGDSTERPPELLDAAILFAPVGSLVPAALSCVRKAGTVVCAGIHMTEIPAFPYALLWGERTVRSVANLTRRDGLEFLALAGACPLRTLVESYPLSDANTAIDSVRHGTVQGAAAVVP
ncbi:MAG: zinc-dependent alcohol dehydrogenase family protein [Vicinamibacterales bacterium]